MFSFMREEEGVYDVEYASSGRAKCKLCFMKIENKSLRISIMVEGPYGESPHWYHMPCFFKKQRPKNISAIAGVDYLKPEDQKKIRKNIGKCSGLVGHCIVKLDSDCKHSTSVSTDAPSGPAISGKKRSKAEERLLKDLGNVAIKPLYYV